MWRPKNTKATSSNNYKVELKLSLSKESIDHLEQLKEKLDISYNEIVANALVDYVRKN